MIKLNFQGLTPQKLGQTDRQTLTYLYLRITGKLPKIKNYILAFICTDSLITLQKIHQRVYQKQQVSNLHHNARISYCARRFIVVFVESAETLFV